MLFLDSWTYLEQNPTENITLNGKVTYLFFLLMNFKYWIMLTLLWINLDLNVLGLFLHSGKILLLSSLCLCVFWLNPKNFVWLVFDGIFTSCLPFRPSKKTKVPFFFFFFLYWCLTSKNIVENLFVHIKKTWKLTFVTLRFFYFLRTSQTLNTILRAKVSLFSVVGILVNFEKLLLKLQTVFFRKLSPLERKTSKWKTC